MCAVRCAPACLALAVAAFAGCRAADADPPPHEERAAPVITARVEIRDVPEYLDGLGTAIGWRTVSIHTQVDGKLLDVKPVEGQEVRRGDLLAVVDPRPFEAQLHQAEGALARDTALLDQSRINLKRITALRARHLVSKENVGDQRALVKQYVGATRLDRAQIEAARLNVEYSRISAPFDGTVGIRLVDPGTLVHPGDATGILVLTQLDPMMVLVTLPQDDLPVVERALRRGPIQVEVYSRDGAQRLATGQATILDNQVNLGTATIRLKAAVPNRERALWPNQFVKARVLAEVRPHTTVVPATAIQRGPQGPFAFVVGPDSTATPRPVQVDRTLGDLTLVKSGLAAGEVVVIEGQSQLRPGARVAPHAASSIGGRD